MRERKQLEQLCRWPRMEMHFKGGDGRAGEERDSLPRHRALIYRSGAWIFPIISFSLVPNLPAVRCTLAPVLETVGLKCESHRAPSNYTVFAAWEDHVNPSSWTASGRQELCLVMNLKEDVSFFSTPLNMKRRLSSGLTSSPRHAEERLSCSYWS